MTFNYSISGRFSRSVSVSALVALLSGGAVSAQNADNTVLYFGLDRVRNGTGAYGGFVYALGGDTSATGWTITTNLDYSHFSSTGSTTDTYGGSVALGYQWHTPDFFFTIGLGADVIDNTDTPPSGSPLEGRHVGGILQIGFETKAQDAAYFMGYGAYASALERSYTQLRLGYQSTSLTYGIEAVYADELASMAVARLGVFIGGIQLGNGYLGLSAGYEDELGATANDGAYVALEYSIPLRF